MFHKLAKHFYPSGYNSHCWPQELSFTDYIAYMRNAIENSRDDFDNPLKSVIIDANSPAQSIPSSDQRTAHSDTGVLLIHGLLDSPNAMSSLFDYYTNQGYWVRTLLLPGHGTVPGDLINVKLHDWMLATRFGIDSFRLKVKKLIVIGFSTGASLALYQAILGAPIDGLILFAPAIMIANRLAYFAHFHKILSWAAHRAHWFLRAPESDYAKYQSIPFNGPYQVSVLSRRLLQYNRFHSVQPPIYTVLSADDEVINTAAMLQFFKHQNNTANQCLLYSNTQPNNDDPRITVIPTAHAKYNILDYSHPCLTVAPDHAHYGINGDYADFLHYQLSWGKPFAHAHSGPIHYGSVSLHNLRNYRLQRLRYNPDFYPMMQRIDTFLEKI